MVIGLVGSVAFNALFVLALGWGVHGQRPGHGARPGLLVFGGAAVLRACAATFPCGCACPPCACSFAHGSAPSSPSGCRASAVQAGMAIVNFVINLQLVNIRRPDAHRRRRRAGGHWRGAAHRACSRCMPLIGIAIALQPLLGFNYGAHNVNRVRKTLWYGIGAASSISRAHVHHRRRCSRCPSPMPSASPTTASLISRLFAIQRAVPHAALRGLPDRQLELLPGHGPAGQVGVPHA